MSVELGVAGGLSETLPPVRRPRPRWYWPVIIVGSLVVIATVRVLTGANDMLSSGALAAAIGLAVPLALNKVPPNRRYGFRVPATLADAGLWYRVNAATGRFFIACGLLMAAHGLAMFVGVLPAGLPWLVLGIFLPVLLAVVASSISFRRALGAGLQSR